MSRRPASSLTQAELSLLPGLKSCLVNLPASLVELLNNINAIVQNVVVEVQFKQNTLPAVGGKEKPNTATKSVFLGWTGMQSQTRRSLTSISGRSREESPVVEVDATFGRLVGLNEGAKVNVMLHLNPPQAHTVNIEPLTPTDWEIIELHARFLEMNFISQVRALPNPADTNASHALTLHLSPTSTASIIVTGLTPAPSATQPFVKLAPDAEVIVAPKARSSGRATNARDSQSITSAGRRSTGGRSAGGRSAGAASRHKSHKDLAESKPPMFLRGVSRMLVDEYFEMSDAGAKDEGLKIWLTSNHTSSKTLRGATWVSISIVNPAGLQDVDGPVEQSEPSPKPATRIVARLQSWDDAPDSHHVALSSLLCEVLGHRNLMGGVVRIDHAPSPLPRTASAMKDPISHASKDAIVKKLRVTPFLAPDSVARDGALKFGGDDKTAESLLKTHASALGRIVSSGPITDGMLIPTFEQWSGGIVDFDPPPPGDPAKPRLQWLLAGERKLDITMQAAIPASKPRKTPGQPLYDAEPELVGVDSIMDKCESNLAHLSSVLLAGGLGSGKTAVVQLLAYRLQRQFLFHASYLSCRLLISDETRIKTIKDTLQRAFAMAAWSARFGGRSVLILDDIDRLCPAETELQVDANGRSRQISELLLSLVRKYCNQEHNVVLLATAQTKEALNNLIISGHLVREVIALKAPDKEGRRKVLDLLVNKSIAQEDGVTQNASEDWMDHTHVEEEEDMDVATNGQPVEADATLDLLDIAGQTDGYMPGDLITLVSRARSEALIRAVSEDSTAPGVTLQDKDFSAAIKGFTPASLRGVTLQSSTTTFASIGGLRETRQTLLETLQYPTTYAPLFSKCPLRLRSGLLLYGYPGCGKTMLASAVAGECGLNFISVKGPEILNKYIGASEKSVRDLFERAEAAKPCVLFFDEFDSIAPKRGHDSTGVTDRVVNMLLTMMDGAEGLSGVYVLAATSRPDLIDPALLRPGRLDKSLICDMPNEEDRLEILRAVGAKLKFDSMVLYGRGQQSLAEVARRTAGYSGADLQAIVYNASLEAIHDILGSSEDVIADYSRKKSANSKTGKQQQQQDFSYFQLGDEGKKDGVVPLSTIAAERAQIAGKLAGLQLAKRKARQERHAAQGRPQLMFGSQANGTSTEEQQPKIEWRHLVKSLQSTRPSIGAQEQKRLAAIYREFTTGRNGEMSDGSGTTEIGGRTSLA